MPHCCFDTASASKFWRYKRVQEIRLPGGRQPAFNRMVTPQLIAAGALLGSLPGPTVVSDCSDTVRSMPAWRLAVMIVFGLAQSAVSITQLQNFTPRVRVSGLCLD